MKFDERYQVYRDGGMFPPVPLSHTQSTLAVPLIPNRLDHGFIIKGTDSNDTLERFYNETFPWIIQGKIVNGKMEIKFPNVNIALDSKYESTFTEGTRIANIQVFGSTHYRWEDYALKKYINDPMLSDHRIYIYYASADFDKFHNGSLLYDSDTFDNAAIPLKAGWNFIESYLDRSDGLPGTWKIGKISQNINDFYNMGYRWFSDGGWVLKP